MSALPDTIPDLNATRCITEATQKLFNLRVQGDRWIYQTRTMSGESCERSKSFFSVAPLFFIQAVGRFVRMPRGAQSEQSAYLFVPSDERLTSHIQDMRGLEAELHEYYSEKHINGEWFALTDDDLAELRQLSGAQ